MSSRTVALSVGSLLWLLGCASEQRTLVLEPVGPRPFPQDSQGQKGSLVVFSAPDSDAHFYSVPGHVNYTDYNLWADTGTFLRCVHNDSGTSVTGPVTVTLPAGSYRVVAKANGYGTVTVPVVIVSRRTTTVHLEGGFGWQGLSGLPSGTPVRLPHGEIVGWSAEQRTNPDH